MASRDGFVTTLLTIPEELVWIVERYQKDMKIASRNGAFRTLLETHPVVAEMVTGLYDVGSHTGGVAHGERVAST